MKKLVEIVLSENENFKYCVCLDEMDYNILKGIAMKSKRSWYYPSTQDRKTLEYIMNFKKSVGEDKYKVLLEHLGLTESLIERVLER